MTRDEWNENYAYDTDIECCASCKFLDYEWSGAIYCKLATAEVDIGENQKTDPYGKNEN